VGARLLASLVRIAAVAIVAIIKKIPDRAPVKKPSDEESADGILETLEEIASAEE
jgi:hypothetical protein